MTQDFIVKIGDLKYRARKNHTDLLFLLSPAEELNDLEIKQNMHILDIGAHIGKYTLFFAKKVGIHGKVVAIEPHPNNFDALTYNVNLNNSISNRILLYKAAVSSFDGYVDLQGERDDGFYISNINRISNSGYSFKVKAVKIDSLMRNLPFQQFNIIKIDVEGSESSVLEGMIETLKKMPMGSLIFIEIWKRNKQVNRILQESGFLKTKLFSETKNTRNFLYKKTM